MRSFLELLIYAFPFLMKGALITILITIFSVLLGFSLAVVMVYLRNNTNIYISKLIGLYEWVFRGLPVLVLLLLIWLIPYININSFLTIIIGLGLRSSAYQSQIIRGALNSISRVQTEAGLSLGLTKFKTFLFITFPQSIKLSLPGLSNEFTIILKDSPLAYVVAVAELLKRAENIISSNFRPFEIYLMCAVIYFVIYIIVETIFKYINRSVYSESFVLQNKEK